MKSTSINSDVAPDAVIPADAGIQSNQASGFRVQPGMTMDGSSLNTATLETTAPLARPVRHTLWRARHLHWLMQASRLPDDAPAHQSALKAGHGLRSHLRDAAWRALAWIKRNQRTMGDDLALRDALPCAVPIWSGPAAFCFDTLSAKYFADALMMDMVGISIPPEVPGVRHA